MLVGKMAPHIIISIIFRIIKTTMGMKPLIQPLGTFKGKMNQIFHINAILKKQITTKSIENTP